MDYQRFSWSIQRWLHFITVAVNDLSCHSLSSYESFRKMTLTCICKSDCSYTTFTRTEFSYEWYKCKTLRRAVTQTSVLKHEQSAKPIVSYIFFLSQISQNIINISFIPKLNRCDKLSKQILFPLLRRQLNSNLSLKNEYFILEKRMSSNFMPGTKQLFW
jgi:hypothetical protein